MDINEFCARKTAAEKAIKAHGFKLEYREYCEDSRTPGFLGQIRGKVDYEQKLVVISTKANRTGRMTINALEHELRHLNEPEWDCGSKDVYGLPNLIRGGKTTCQTAQQ